MSYKTVATYKFGLDEHPILKANLIEANKIFMADGKTDGIPTTIPVNDPASRLEPQVVTRDWATWEHAQEWATVWQTVCDQYAATDPGKSIPDLGYTIEIVSS